MEASGGENIEKSAGILVVGIEPAMSLIINPSVSTEVNKLEVHSYSARLLSSHNS